MVTMKQGYLQAILVIVCFGLVINTLRISHNYQQYRESTEAQLNFYQSYKVKVLNCGNEQDELVKLWCEAREAYRYSAFFGQTGAEQSFISGWIGTINSRVSGQAAKTLTPDSTGYDVWHRAGVLAEESLDQRGMDWEQVFPGQGKVAALKSDIEHAYQRAKLVSNTSVTREQYAMGYLSGRLLTLTESHSLGRLRAKGELQSYSDSIADDLMLESASEIFNKGIQDGVYVSVVKMHQSLLKASRV